MRKALILSLVLALMRFSSSPLAAATLAQSIGLKVGWNAVWLEVTPTNPDGSLCNANQVFTSPDFLIDKVATPLLKAGYSQFSTTNSGSSQSGWAVWSTNASSSQNSSLLVGGNQAYLVHVQETLYLSNGCPAGSLVVTGSVVFHRPSWVRGEYNLIGFGVSGGPTFKSLLAAGQLQGSDPSKIISNLNLQRLDPTNGEWTAVTLNEPVESGHAYWIKLPFELKTTTYAGPVAVNFSGAALGSLAFGDGPGSVVIPDPSGTSNQIRVSSAELTFSSLESPGSSAHRVTLTKLAPLDPDPAAKDLQLYPLSRILNQLAWQSTESSPLVAWTVTNLLAADTRTVTLGLNRNWTSNGNFREQLYRIDVALSASSFCYFYLPVNAINSDVPPIGQVVASDSNYAGLWVGSVSVDSVTSLADPLHPLTKAASPAPLKLLIHVDTNGNPSLLSHVLLMQTKTADPSVTPHQVLVVDESKIPYYEGIQERGGKKVGIRYETAAFDLPRDGTAAAQPTLTPVAFQSLQTNLGYTNQGQLSEADFYTYLAAQSTRPIPLQETYHLAWSLTGALAPGGVLQTAPSAPLRLDPFHRSNPFRHAFHPQHGTGYDIARAIQINFDTAYQAGVLSGVYRETVTGLSQFPLVSQGRISLQRLSGVSELQ